MGSHYHPLRGELEKVRRNLFKSETAPSASLSEIESYSPLTSIKREQAKRVLFGRHFHPEKEVQTLTDKEEE